MPKLERIALPLLLTLALAGVASTANATDTAAPTAAAEASARYVVHVDGMT